MRKSLLHGQKQNKISFKDFKSLVSHPSVKPFIQQEMQQTGLNAKLRGFEHVKAIHLSHELFSVENGILTPTFKLKRNEAKKKFQTAINEMYAIIEEQAKKDPRSKL